MQKRQTVTAMAIALGLIYMPPTLFADHHGGADVGHSAHGAETTAKGGASDMKDTATAGAEAKMGETADAVKDAAAERSAAGMAETTSKKMPEGSH